MIFIIEAVVACVVFTLSVLTMMKNPLNEIYSYPPNIISRVIELGLIEEKKTPNRMEVIRKKWPAIVLDVIWFCHSKRVRIPGTEDMVSDYQDYWFHIRSSMIGMLLGLPACLIAGLVCQLLP